MYTKSFLKQQKQCTLFFYKAKTHDIVYFYFSVCLPINYISLSQY